MINLALSGTDTNQNSNKDLNINICSKPAPDKNVTLSRKIKVIVLDEHQNKRMQTNLRKDSQICHTTNIYKVEFSLFSLSKNCFKFIVY